MSKKDTYLTYTGDIRGLVTDGKQIAFVTEHAESQPTAIFLIDAETNKQTQIDLPCGGVSILKTGKTFWVGGTDGSLYTATDKQAKAAPAKLPCVATKLIQVSETEIACLTGQQVQIVDAKGKIAQTIELSSAVEKPKTMTIPKNRTRSRVLPWLAAPMEIGWSLDWPTERFRCMNEKPNQNSR